MPNEDRVETKQGEANKLSKILNTSSALNLGNSTSFDNIKALINNPGALQLELSVKLVDARLKYIVYNTSSFSYEISSTQGPMCEVHGSPSCV